MTLRELVACASPLADGNTVRDHLAATDCGSLGGGGTIINVYPLEETVSIEEPVIVDELDEEVKILEQDVIIISDEEIVNIEEIIGDSINGIC